MFTVTIIRNDGSDGRSWDAKDEAHAERIAQRQRAMFPVGSSKQIRIRKA